MFKSRVMILFMLVSLLGLGAGLVACGGGGGLSSGGGIGGVGANHPIVGGTVQAYINGAWTNVSTTTTNGQVTSFSSSLLSGATYPLVFRIQPGTGYIQGYSSAIKYQGELKSVYSSQPTSIYFSLLTTMVTNLYEAVQADYPTDAAALAYATGRVQAVVSSFGLSAFDPMTTNPYTSFDSALIQAALWSGYGMDFSDPSASSSVDNLVNAVTTQLETAGTAPATALQNSLPQVAAQISAEGSSAAGLEGFINTVKADATVTAGIATSYASSSFGTTSAAVSTTMTNTATDPTTQMANYVGQFYISAYGGTAGGGAIRNNANYTILSTEAGNTITYTVTIKDANGANLTDTVTATLSNSAVGTLDSTSKAAVGGAATFTLTLANPLPAGESFTLTFANTKSGVTSQAVTTGLTQSSGDDIPAGISAITAQTGGNNKRLLHMNSGNSYTDADTYALSATVTELAGGAFTAGVINVNFIAPTGVKFKIGSNSYSNYMVGVSTNTAAQNVQFIGTSAVANGRLGPVRAELYYKATGAKVSPTIANAAAGDFWAYTGTAVSDIRRLVLTAGGTANLDASAVVDGGTVNLSSGGNQLSLAFITWDGDTEIDTIEAAADNSAAINTQLASRNMKLFTDAPTGGGFDLGSSQYGNVELGIASGSTSDGQGNSNLAFANARFSGIAADTYFSGYKRVVGSTTDNIDNVYVQLFDTAAYSGTFNLSSSAIIRYK